MTISRLRAILLVAGVSVLGSTVHAQLPAGCAVWSRAENRCIQAAPAAPAPVAAARWTPAQWRGVQPISPAGVTAAQLIDGADMPGSPYVLGMAASGYNAARMRKAEQAPFFLIISTPFTRVAWLAIEARRTFTQATLPSIDALNSGQVQVLVSPGSSMLTVDTIENLVIKRGDQVIRALESKILPTVVQNSLGAKKVSANGVFTYDFSTFDPAKGPLTVVMIGSRGNFEWDMTADDLSQLR